MKKKEEEEKESKKGRFRFSLGLSGPPLNFRCKRHQSM